MSKAFRWNMLVTSFLPLWASVLFLLTWDILAVDYRSFGCLFQAKGVEFAFAVVVIIVVSVSTASMVSFLNRKNKPEESSGSGKIATAKKSATLATDFLLTYIMPLIAFDFTDMRDIALFVAYFVIIAFLNIRNGNVYTNILFEFMGYRVYVCDIERNVIGKTYNYTDCTVISKYDLTGKISQDFRFFDFDNDIYLKMN